MITRHMVYLPVRDGTRLIGFVAMHADRSGDLRCVIPIVRDRRSGEQHHVDIDKFSSMPRGRIGAFLYDPDAAPEPMIFDQEFCVRAALHQSLQWWRDIAGFVEIASEDYFHDRLRERERRLAALNENARAVLPAVLGEGEGR